MELARRCVAVALLLVAATAPIALAAERAAVAVHAGGVDFSPGVDYAHATLTVSGNGIHFSRAIERGGRISLGTFDQKHGQLPDGIYTWRLDLMPDEATARALRSAAMRHGGTPPEAWIAQSGTFAISGGSVVSPEHAEPEPIRLPGGISGATQAAVPGLASLSRGPSEDTDEAVGDRPDTEELVAAAAARARPVAPTGALQLADRKGESRSDAMATALGRSPETVPQAGAGAREQPYGRKTQPKSDGTNGRPRSQ